MQHRMNRSLRDACWILPVLAIGCAGDSNAPDGQHLRLSSEQSMLRNRAASVQHRRVRPGVDNALAVEALPNAMCRLYAEEATGSDTAGLDVYSDDEGRIPLYFRPDPNSTVVELSLDCQDDSGATASYRLDLEPAADTPLLEAPAVKGRLRAPLSGDPLAPTTAELVAMGYPPRPDPVTAPEAYQRWLIDASTPMTMVDVKPVSTRRRNDHKTPNWVGAASVTGGPFRQARAYWSLPAVQGESNHADSVVIWPGIGGFDGSAMWQGGTTQDWYNPGSGYIWANNFWFELIASNDCCGAVPQSPRC